MITHPEAGIVLVEMGIQLSRSDEALITKLLPAGPLRTRRKVPFVTPSAVSVVVVTFVKVALVLRYAFIVNVAVLPDDVSTPVQAEKLKPGVGFAVSCTACPVLYHGPAGFGATVPPPTGD